MFMCVLCMFDVEVLVCLIQLMIYVVARTTNQKCFDDKAPEKLSVIKSMSK